MITAENLDKGIEKGWATTNKIVIKKINLFRTNIWKRNYKINCVTKFMGKKVAMLRKIKSRWNLLKFRDIEFNRLIQKNIKIANDINWNRLKQIPP